jgi:hypothetical protein
MTLLLWQYLFLNGDKLVAHLAVFTLKLFSFYIKVGFIFIIDTRVLLYSGAFR